MTPTALAGGTGPRTPMARTPRDEVLSRVRAALGSPPADG